MRLCKDCRWFRPERVYYFIAALAPAFVLVMFYFYLYGDPARREMALWLALAFIPISSLLVYFCLWLVRSEASCGCPSFGRNDKPDLVTGRHPKSKIRTYSCVRCRARDDLCGYVGRGWEAKR